MMKRTFDLALCAVTLLILGIPFLIVFAAVKLTSPGPALHWSKRIGRNNKQFLMPKFRSMKIDTPQVATHLLQDPSNYLTPIGNFIRKSSVDELPQIISVFRGDMSIVGPRPALFNQQDLIKLRSECGVEKLKPGITGWAQVNGRDEISIQKKVELDKFYLDHQSISFDIKIIFLTAVKVINRDGINH